MRATPPARALAWLVDVLDRSWGLIGLAACFALVVFVFASPGMLEWMLGAGIVGAALVVAWLGTGARWRS